MKCPVCRTEGRIYHIETVEKDDKWVVKMVYVCRNKLCRNFNKEIGREEKETKD